MDSLTGVASGDVRFTPESRHKRRVRLMSANDPKRTLWDHPAQARFSNPANGILTLESDNNFPETVNSDSSSPPIAPLTYLYHSGAISLEIGRLGRGLALNEARHLFKRRYETQTRRRKPCRHVPSASRSG